MSKPLKATESWTEQPDRLRGWRARLWGYFLYQGVIDPLGGISTLWPLFGVANQMLAAIALILCTVVLFKMKRERYAWVTLVPAAWLVVCTVTAGLEKVVSPDPKVGFVSHALALRRGGRRRQILAPAKTLDEMGRIVFNDYVDAALAALFVAIVIAMVVYGVLERPSRRCAARSPRPPKSAARRWRRNETALEGAGETRLRHGRADRPPDGRRARITRPMSPIGGRTIRVSR